MSSAEKQPKRDINERCDLLIAQYQAAYSEAADAARAAAKTTATEAWQNNFREQMANHQEVVANCNKSIMAQCDTIKNSDSSEEIEKGIKDAVKQMADERIRYSAWRTRTIHAYKDAADKCVTLKGNTIRAAETDEREQPLLHRGLAEQVRLRVNTWPDAKWNEERGVVEFTDRNTGEMIGA